MGDSKDKRYIWDELDSDKSTGSVSYYDNNSYDSSKKITELEQELDRKLEAVASEIVPGSSVISSLNTDDLDTHYSTTSRTQYKDIRSNATSSILISDDESATGINSIVTQISNKVNRMREELQMYTLRIRDLTGELQRLQTATDRRTAKCQANWNVQLQTASSEHDEVQKKLKHLCDRLQQETRKLEQQQNALSKRLDQTRKDRQRGLQKAEAELTKRLQRAKRQWEHDEKLSCEKALRGKSETIQQQAAASFGPKLDRLVSDGKQKVDDRREAGRVAMEKQRLSLQLRNEQQVGEEHNRLNEENLRELNRARDRLQRKRMEIERSWEQEVNLMREHIEKEKAALEDSVSHTSKIEEEHSQQTLQSLVIQESQQVQELVAKQQREVELLLNSQHREIEELSSQLEKQQQDDEERSNLMRKEIQNKRIEHQVDEERRKVAAETESILQQLREDSRQQRQRTKQLLDDTVEDLRLKVQSQQDIYESSEKRNLNLIATLRVETKSSQDQLRELRSKIIAAKVSVGGSDADAKTSSGSTMKGGLKQQMQRLRMQLREVESEWNVIAPQQEEEVLKRQQEIHHELRSWETRRDDIQSRLIFLRSDHATQLDNARNEYEADMSRIRSKVTCLLKRKSETKNILKQELLELQECSTSLQGQLEDLRDTKFGL